MFTIQNRKTKAVSEMVFDTKWDAAKWLIFNHGMTWDRRYYIITK